MLVLTFRKTKRLLKSGKVQHLREIIEQYVDRIIIHKDYIEVYFSFGLGDHEKDRKIPQDSIGQSENPTVFDSLPTVQIDSLTGRDRDLPQTISKADLFSQLKVLHISRKLIKEQYLMRA